MWEGSLAHSERVFHGTDAVNRKWASLMHGLKGLIGSLEAPNKALKDLMKKLKGLIESLEGLKKIFESINYWLSSRPCNVLFGPRRTLGLQLSGIVCSLCLSISGLRALSGSRCRVLSDLFVC